MAQDDPGTADSEESSHKQILRSSSIIGGASVINIAVGLAKTKIVAILLGPAGVGLVVLLQNLLQTVSSIAGLSIGAAGTREVAEANSSGDPARMAIARRALAIGSLSLAAIGAAAFWILSDVLGALVSTDPAATDQIDWLAVGVLLTIAAQAQMALLTGFRRVGDLARSSILSVVVSAAIGIAAVFAWGRAGIVIFVVAPTVATFLISHLYVARLPKAPAAPAPAKAVAVKLQGMIRFGVALTVAAAAVNAGQLAARTFIQSELGESAVGYFQASWLISITYIGFILQAMGTDLYPRITEKIGDKAMVNRLINEQTEVALLLAAPVLLISIAGAPWIIHLLYSSAFQPAVPVLQWQVMGDVLKVASWPLGYLLLAAGAARVYMIGEITAIAVLLAVLVVGLPVGGLEASGMAVLAMYLFYLPYVFVIARRRTGFGWTRVNIALIAGLFAACGATISVSRLSPVAGAAFGATLGLAAGILCLKRLSNSLPGPIQSVFARLRRAKPSGS
jgi:PST family polysaccharide transporter